MSYQYVREPLTAEEADRLANACETPTEQLIVWTLLDTGLRVSELCALTTKDILWQQRLSNCRLRRNIARLTAEPAAVFCAAWSYNHSLLSRAGHGSNLAEALPLRPANVAVRCVILAACRQANHRKLRPVANFEPNTID